MLGPILDPHSTLRSYIGPDTSVDTGPRAPFEVVCIYLTSCGSHFHDLLFPVVGTLYNMFQVIQNMVLQNLNVIDTFVF